MHTKSWKISRKLHFTQKIKSSPPTSLATKKVLRNILIIFLPYFLFYFRVPLKPGEAASARDALTKAIYARLFDYIVNRVNKALPFQSSKNYIGVLDIAGFGMFSIKNYFI